MLKRGNYPKELLDTVSDGFRGEMELLRYEYEKRRAAIFEKIDLISSATPAFAEAAQWKVGLEADREETLTGITGCIQVMEKMETKVKEGLLSLMDEQVVADVTAHELDILSRLTALQRINSASMQRTFLLSLPAKVKSLDKDSAAILREAIVMQMEDGQFMSNELQELAIFIKERNKIITHPLDENHPE